MSDSLNLLEVKNLSAAYGKVPVLHGITLDVAEREIVGVLGHNGMGKTTLLKTVMGFVPTTAGNVRWDGKDVTTHKPYQHSQAGIGYVPQGRGIFPNLTVAENLRFAYHDVGQLDEQDTVDSVLAEFGRLTRLMSREGGALSGGEQQLLALARCLMASPALMLLDEPTEGIQPSIIEEIAETLLTLRKERGLSILLVEQNLDFIADLSDRVLVLERGHIKAELSSAQLADDGLVDEFLGFGAARRTRIDLSGSAPATGSDRLHQTMAIASPKLADLSPSGLLGLPPLSSGRTRAHLPANSMAADTLLSQQAATQVFHMTIQRPTIEQMRTMATRMGMSMSDQVLGQYLDIMEPYIQGYDQLDAMPDNLPEVKYPRSPGVRPKPADNPLNAWYVKTDIRGASHGPLSGRSIVLKDTVCLAGVPMMNGSTIMEGYIPEIDATIVTRILDAGGTIVGKSHSENLCLSGGSHTNATGPIHNPYKRGYMAGGSSSGSAALVAAGEVDMAIAGDQGGSIRIPASNCGVYGMKPTHGLVPYTGVMPIEVTIDHVGPLTNTTADNALFLEVLAGADGLDPRQYNPQVSRYTEAIGRGVAGMRIGVLKEGFNRPESEADVDAKVMAAAERFRALGAIVEQVSLPDHLLAPAYWTAVTVEGLQDMMMNGNCTGTNRPGLYLPSMTDHFSSWRHRTGELSASLKVCMFLGEYFQTQYRGRFYGKAQNLIRGLKDQYLKMLQGVDLLLMPTVPMKAQPIPPADASLELYVQRAFEMVGNTVPFSSNGLPVMSVPCGLSEGLPIGMSLVGKPYAESTIYQASDAFEKQGDWRTF